MIHLWFHKIKSFLLPSEKTAADSLFCTWKTAGLKTAEESVGRTGDERQGFVGTERLHSIYCSVAHCFLFLILSFGRPAFVFLRMNYEV